MIHSRPSRFVALGAIDSSVSQVDSLCAQERTQLRRDLKASRRVEMTVIVGGALVTLLTLALDELGHRQLAKALGAIATLGGAAYAVLRLSSED